MDKLSGWYKIAMDLINRTKPHDTILYLTSNPRAALYALLITCFSLWIIAKGTALIKRPTRSRPNTPDLEKPATRSFKAPPREPGGEPVIIELPDVF